MLTVKLTPEEREIAFLLPYVTRASYLRELGLDYRLRSGGGEALEPGSMAARELIRSRRRST